MSGQKRFLSPKKRIVIDTHVLAAATRKEVHQRHPDLKPENPKQEDDAYELVTEVLEHSPVLVFSPEQWKEASAHAKIQQPAFFDIIRELDERDKLQRIDKSKIKSLSNKIEDSLEKKRGGRHLSSRRGHQGVQDDIHLFRAAYITDKTLITEDSNILDDENRKNMIFDEAGIRVFSVSEALEQHKSTKES